MDRRCEAATGTLLHDLVELLAVASGDGASLRALDDDGILLLPVAAHSADPRRDAAMHEVMEQTQRTDEGLWRVVLQQGRTVRWEVDHRSPPGEANSDQAAFILRHAITGVMGTPLVHEGRLVGGLALVRFGTGVPFTDADEDLLTAAAQRIAAVLGRDQGRPSPAV